MLIKRTNPPTAIICGNDVLAIGALSAAQARSIRVPEEISITGFDNLPITEYVWPKLTTIAIPSEQVGYLVAESIVNYLNHGVAIESQILDATLLVRATTAAVPGGRKK